MQKLVLLALYSVYLFGCAHSPVVVHDKLDVELGENVTFRLLAPNTYGKNISFTQVAEIDNGGRTREFLFRVQIIDNALTVAGLLPSGTRIFLISFDGVNIGAEGLGNVIEQLQPKYLIADLQLTMWPYETLLNDGFVPPGCSEKTTCLFSKELKTNSRNLTVSDKKIISISYSPSTDGGNNIFYENFLRKYTIKLKTIEKLAL